MSETLKQQQEKQFDDFKAEYIDALTQQRLSTKKELKDLQDTIISDSSIGDVTKDSGLVEETLGVVPKYFLSQYLSGSFGGAMLTPFLKVAMNQAQFEELKKYRQDLLHLKKSLGKEVFHDNLLALQAKYVAEKDIVLLADTDNFYQDVDSEDIDRSIDFSDKEQILFSDVKSEKFSRNTKTGVTWCSWTARMNADNFGIKIPQGNAFDAKDKPIQDADRFVSTIDKDAGIAVKDIANVDAAANFADIFVQSNGRYSKYGHRAVVFKNMDDGKWYVLDPYRRSLVNDADRSTKTNPSLEAAHKPKSLDDYMKYNAIVKMNFYTAPKAVVNTYKSPDDTVT